MKIIRLLAFATACLLGFTGIVGARSVSFWSYQKLVEKSDLVVLAAPTSTNFTKEHIDVLGEHAIGVETRFAVSAVLKGDKAMKDFVFHHYRTTDGKNIPQVINGPSFISFNPVAKPTFDSQTFILFLIREADGRYAPVVGQTDPGGAVRELR